MNIEEVINNLKKYISFSEKECNFPSIYDWNWNMDLANDIETLLTAYEKEKRLAENHKTAFEKQTENLHEVEELYEKEKEKNKELEKKLDEISEIHFPIIY